MDITWILVANASFAKLFSLPEAKLKACKSNLELINSIEHPESKIKDTEQVSDRSGHLGHGDFAESGAKAHEADKFAKECADLLNEGRVSNAYKSIVMVAPPAFYGMIGKHLNKHVAGVILKTIEKDYTKISEDELINHLNEAFKLK